MTEYTVAINVTANTAGAQQAGAAMGGVRREADALNRSTGNLSSGVGGLGGSMQRAGDSAGSLTGRLGGLAQMAVGALTRGALAAAAAVASLAAAGIATRTHYEELAVEIRHTADSIDDARSKVDALAALARKNGESVDDLKDAYLTLADAGLPRSMRAIQAFGNIAANSGKSIDDLSAAIGESLKGEMDALADFGITAVRTGDKIAFTFDGITTTVRATAKSVEDYLLTLGNNQLSGRWAEQADTANGSMGRVTDAVQRLGVALVDQTGVWDVYSGGLAATADMLDDLAAAIDPAIGDMVTLDAAMRDSEAASDALSAAGNALQAELRLAADAAAENAGAVDGVSASDNAATGAANALTSAKSAQTTTITANTSALHANANALALVSQQAAAARRSVDGLMSGASQSATSGNLSAPATDFSRMVQSTSATAEMGAKALAKANHEAKAAMTAYANIVAVNPAARASDIAKAAATASAKDLVGAIQTMHGLITEAEAIIPQAKSTGASARGGGGASRRGGGSGGAGAAEREAERQERELTRIREEGIRQREQLDRATIEHHAEMALTEVDAEEQASRERQQMGIQSAQQTIAQDQQFEKRRYQIRLQALQAKLALEKQDPDKNPVAAAQLNMQMQQLEQQHQLKLMQIRRQSYFQSRQLAADFVRSSMGGFQQSLAGVLATSKTIGDGVKGLFSAAGSAEANMIAEMVARWATNTALAAIYGKVGALTQIGANAAAAGSGAYAATAMIPVIGPALAPAAAATAYTGAMSFAASIPAAAKGFDIPSGLNPVTQLHQKEMVLPANLADRVRNMTGGDGGVTFNINAMDARDVKRLLSNEGGAMSTALRREIRNFRGKQ